MKRHPSLAPLSKEHHPVLILAQLLKKDGPAYKGMPTAPADKAAYALNLFHADIKGHFSKEEMLLQKLAGLNAQIDMFATEIVQEHRDLASDFAGITSSADLVNALDVLGRKLEEHIRKEERKLFPLIEQYCPATLLDEIATLLK